MHPSNACAVRSSAWPTATHNRAEVNCEQAAAGGDCHWRGGPARCAAAGAVHREEGGTVAP
jgi:hypothetical protein